MLTTLFDGIGYTDAHARIPAHNILVGVSIVCALLFFAGALMRSWALPGLSLALLLLTAILIGGIWPFVMQSFQVKPSEPDKEGPYIARNITATREAYGVADTKARAYSAKTSLTGAELSRSAESRVSTRLLDPTLIAPARRPASVQPVACSCAKASFCCASKVSPDSRPRAVSAAHFASSPGIAGMPSCGSAQGISSAASVV